MTICGILLVMELNRPSLGAIILAGGKSRRMGRTKGLIKVEGVSMLRRAWNLARAATPCVWVVRRDRIPGLGPIGGIFTALHACDKEWLLILPCDMPFLQPETVSRLVNFTRSSVKARFTATSEGPGFPILLHRGNLAIIQAMLDKNELSLRKLFERTQAELYELPAGSESELRNCNTPDDLR
jgi:molybdopterin-guanine dinucleotide biosynthesis protein A